VFHGNNETEVYNSPQKNINWDKRKAPHSYVTHQIVLLLLHVKFLVIRMGLLL